MWHIDNSSFSLTSSITASPVLYAEGGGGANYCMPTSPPNLSQGSGGNAGYGPYPSCNTTGGTGAVNHLEDYEVGTWVPAYGWSDAVQRTLVKNITI